MESQISLIKGQLHTEKEKAGGPRRQRLEGRSHKSRNAGGYWALLEASNWIISQSFRRIEDPTDTLILDFWPVILF